MDRHKKRELQRESLGKVRHEIVAERAAALARISRAFTRQIERLHLMREQIPGTLGPKRCKHAAAYEALRRKAETYRWYLKVQREVNGLYDGETFEASNPIPAPLDY